MDTSTPFITILTPVYNGEKYLGQCIESVLAQSYSNWEHIIVNNCSTDNTLEIARRYSKGDPRIKVAANPSFVGVVENHNIAFGLASPKSRYRKVVSADDWLYPECIAKLVELAEAHPNVGIVGSYQQSGNEIRWKGLPVEVSVISGREVCRKSLLDDLNVFGTPTSSLYRSDLLPGGQQFFPHSLPHADTSACYKYLQSRDYGFVHEVLSVERLHDQQISERVRELVMGSAALLQILLEYGPTYLTEEELETRQQEMLAHYHKWLGGCVWKRPGGEFWRFHTSRLRELGVPIDWKKVMGYAIREIGQELHNPLVAFRKLMDSLKR